MTTELIAFRVRTGSIAASGFQFGAQDNLERMGEFFIVPRNTVCRVRRVYGSFAAVMDPSAGDRRMKIIFGAMSRIVTGGPDNVVSMRPLWTHIATHQSSTVGWGPRTPVQIDTDLSSHIQREIRSKGARSNTELGFGFVGIASIESAWEFFLDAVVEFELEWLGGPGSKKDINVVGGFDELENQDDA